MKYKNWKVYNFLDENTKMAMKRNQFAKDKIGLQQMIEDIKYDNNSYKEQEKTNDTKSKDIKDEKQRKINCYIDSYNKKIRVLHAKIQIIRNILQGTNKTLKMLVFNKKEFLRNIRVKNTIYIQENSLQNLNNKNLKSLDKSPVHIRDKTQEIRNEESEIYNKKVFVRV